MGLDEKLFIKWLNIAFVAILLSSLPIAVIPWADFDGNALQKTLAYAIGLIFWGFLITGIAFFIRANSKRKSLQTKRSVKSKKRRNIPGFRVLNTEQGANADMLFIILLACYFGLVLFKFDNALIKTELVFLLVLSFQMRCILNGENFKYKKYILRRREK